MKGKGAGLAARTLDYQRELRAAKAGTHGVRGREVRVER